ncbi:hypothetical protein BC936DRAFT_145624 [Jimgerdemannia flammicorona]|uniref:Cytochrome c oxidase polypeptide VIIA n=1 Tax=Jimgerdemannia flammicorona TaxID=994334 RepID=A0A433D9J8_9FUNG|nr:hypothetical protein BC936DRAFT_145624 [Jimgerdemannia flammicorona]
MNKSQGDCYFWGAIRHSSPSRLYPTPNLSAPNPPINTTMPIAPITGRLRKRFFTDITIALTIGFAGGFSWWHFYHLPIIRKRDAYYARLEARKD